MDIQTRLETKISTYTDSIDGASIRLLRFWKSENGDFVGNLQTWKLASAPHFYTASYVWGEQKFSGTRIQLSSGGSLPVLSSLVPFLHMVTQNDDFHDSDWWWIDSLTINLIDQHEREQQVRIMAEIYKRSRRAIVWLGNEQDDGSSDCSGAIEFLHHLGSLQAAFQGDEHAMREHLSNSEFSSNCIAVTNFLSRPWWTRVWTLQEFVLPKEAKLYCGAKSITRGKFKSAIYSIFLCSTISNDFEHELVPRKIFDGAYNRRRIHQWHTRPKSQGISLVAIMAYLGNYSATDSRDRIYSVMGLITARDRKLIGAPEYSSSVEVQFARLVRSFWNEYNSLDIICFVHIFSRYSGPFDPDLEQHAVPGWTPDWRVMNEFASPVPLMASQSSSPHIGNFRPLKSSHWKVCYDAPGSQCRKKANVWFSEGLQEMQCNGIVLDSIHGLGGLDARELRCYSFVCTASGGHKTCQSNVPQHTAPRATMLPMDWLEAIARSLVLDRQDKYLGFQAPRHYVSDFLFLAHACVDGGSVDWSFSTWFEENRSLRFGEHTLEELIAGNHMDFTSSFPSPVLHRPPSHPMHHHSNDSDTDKVDTFLSRFHDIVRRKPRRLMVTSDGLVGMAPCRSRVGDAVCILFGCSIPLVLRRTETSEAAAWQVVGEGYVHGYMNGEIAGQLKRGRKKKNVYRFRLV